MPQRVNIRDKEPKELELLAGDHTFLAKTKWLGNADFTFANLIIPLILCSFITVVVCVFYLRTLGTNERMKVKEG